MSDSGAQYHKDQTETHENDCTIVSKKIEEALSDGFLNNVFDEVTSRLVKRLENFSKELSVDYHIVLADERLKVRYSIIEGKNPNYAFKELDYGIVGSLLKQRRTKYQSIFVQFKFSNNYPVVAYSESEDSKIEKISPNLMTKLLGKDNDPVWDSKTNDYAIAASLIKDQSGNPIGACSIDFSTNGQFPDFSFRKGEVQEVFDILFTFRHIFERLIYCDPSSTSNIEFAIKKVINIIKGSESNG